MKNLTKDLIELSYEFRCFIHSYNTSLKKPLYDDVVDDVMDKLSKNKFFYIIYQNKGYLLISLDVNNKFITNKTLYICELFVRNQFRNKGIAKSLLSSIIKIPEFSGIYKIFVDINILNNAISFYFKNGFVLQSMQLIKTRMGDTNGTERL